MRAQTPLRPVFQRLPTSFFPMRSPAGYLSLRSFLHYVVTWNQCTSLVCCGHISTSCHGGCLHHACHAATAHCPAAQSLILNQHSPTHSPAHSPAHLLASSLTHQLTRPLMCIHLPAHPHLTPSSPPLAHSPGTAASSVTRAMSTRTQW
jgi:hypothetical protein